MDGTGTSGVMGTKGVMSREGVIRKEEIMGRESYPLFSQSLPDGHTAILRRDREIKLT